MTTVTNIILALAVITVFSLMYFIEIKIKQALKIKRVKKQRNKRTTETASKTLIAEERLNLRKYHDQRLAEIVNKRMNAASFEKRREAASKRIELDTSILNRV